MKGDSIVTYNGVVTDDVAADGDPEPGSDRSPEPAARPGPVDDDADHAVFRALADPGRRRLLDALHEHDGQTLGALCGVLPALTRFGVMKHLNVLADAHLVVTEKVGRSKHHYLNPVPLQRIHRRWLGKFAEGSSDALLDLAAGLAPTSPPTFLVSSNRPEDDR